MTRAEAFRSLMKTASSHAEETDGWFALFPKREHGPKVGIRGDEHSALSSGQVEGLLISCRMLSVISDVRGVMANLPQAFCYAWRHGVVD
jgi:hypothetical protein